MMCMKCKSEQFSEKVTKVEVSTNRGVQIIPSPAMVCNNCGWYTMTDEQADVLADLVSDFNYFFTHNPTNEVGV